VREKKDCCLFSSCLLGIEFLFSSNPFIMKYAEMQCDDDGMSEPFLTDQNATSKTASSDGLTTPTTRYRQVTLYDPQCMMEFQTSLAAGYITLLSNGSICVNNNNKKRQEQAIASSSPKTKAQDEETIALAFAVLISGNVIDACFGVTMSHTKTTINHRLIKEAKTAIEEAAAIDERIRVISTRAYRDAMQVIVETNQKIEKLNVFSKCFKMNSIRRKALTDLEAAFGPAERAIVELI
jgi:hypothetical protein